MKNKIDSKINWNYIFIFDELTAYISIYHLKELSLSSRVIRSRLKPILFAKATLPNKEISKCFDIKELYSKKFKNVNDYSSNIVDANTNFNPLNILFGVLPGIIEPLFINMGLARELNEIASYIKSFRLNGLRHFYKDLLAITISLTNLSQLAISNCEFHILNFLKVGRNLINLKKLALYSVKFKNIDKHEILSDIEYSLSTLEELVIYDCSLPVSNSNLRAISSVGNDSKLNLMQFNHLKWLNIPNLKKVKSFGYNYPKNFLEILLKLNPQVESLTINNYLEIQSVYNQISHSKNLTQLEILPASLKFPHISEDQNFTIPLFIYVENLKIGFEVNECSSNGNFQNIVKYHPSLKRLTLDIGGFEYEDRSINDLFRLNFPFCNGLDSVTLKAFGSGGEVSNYYERKLDCESFVNTKCLILDIPLLSLSEIDFDKFPLELKEVRKLYNNKLCQLQYIQENPNIFRKWNIVFKGKYIYFNK